MEPATLIRPNPACDEVTVLGRGLISPQPNSDGCEFDHGEEVGRELFVAGGDAPELLEFVEAAFDPISQSIQDLAEGMGVLRASPVGDDRDGIAVLDQLADPFSVVGLLTAEE